MSDIPEPSSSSCFTAPSIQPGKEGGKGDRVTPKTADEKMDKEGEGGGGESRKVKPARVARGGEGMVVGLFSR